MDWDRDAEASWLARHLAQAPPLGEEGRHRLDWAVEKADAIPELTVPRKIIPAISGSAGQGRTGLHGTLTSSLVPTPEPI